MHALTLVREAALRTKTIAILALIGHIIALTRILAALLALPMEDTTKTP